MIIIMCTSNTHNTQKSNAAREMKLSWAKKGLKFRLSARLWSRYSQRRAAPAFLSLFIDIECRLYLAVNWVHQFHRAFRLLHCRFRAHRHTGHADVARSPNEQPGPPELGARHHRHTVASNRTHRLGPACPIGCRQLELPQRPKGKRAIFRAAERHTKRRPLQKPIHKITRNFVPAAHVAHRRTW